MFLHIHFVGAGLLSDCQTKVCNDTAVVRCDQYVLRFEISVSDAWLSSVLKEKIG